MDAEGLGEPEKVRYFQPLGAAEDRGEALRAQAHGQRHVFQRPPRKLHERPDPFRQPANLLLVGIGHAESIVVFRDASLLRGPGEAGAALEKLEFPWRTWRRRGGSGSGLENLAAGCPLRNRPGEFGAAVEKVKSPWRIWRCAGESCGVLDKLDSPWRILGRAGEIGGVLENLGTPWTSR
jgi:hypothetical protein